MTCVVNPEVNALQIVHKELGVTMALRGHTDIQNMDSKIMLPGAVAR